jgi:hypothetical protein
LAKHSDTLEAIYEAWTGQRMEISHEYSSPVIIDYYQGAYGPTLRIDVQASERLAQFRKLLCSLAEDGQNGEELRLHEIPWVRLGSAFKAISLKATELGTPYDVILQVQPESVNQIVITWSGNPAYWKRCAGLVDGLLKYAPRPGHQYLTNEATDGTLVELAFMEAPGHHAAVLHTGLRG